MYRPRTAEAGWALVEDFTATTYGMSRSVSPSRKPVHSP